MEEQITGEKPVNYMDLTAERNEYLFKMPASVELWIQSLLLNPQDIVIVRLIFNVSVTVFPSAFLLYYLGNPPFWLGLLHVGMILIVYLQRFVLTLHFASHKQIFESKWFDIYLQYFVCPFFGIPSGTYRNHHVVMHHIENNVFPYDVSSTMTYQRDNPFHFLCYWLRYLFAIWFQLPYYAYKRERYNLMFRTISWCCVYLTMIPLLFHISPVASTWVFIVPFVAVSFLLMLGNWCQHIFIDPLRYDDSYALTYNIINSTMNKLTYNDGYHIVHHLNSTLHWSQLPTYFRNNIEKFDNNNSLTFKEVEYLQIGFYVFFGQYDALVKHYVHLGTPETKKSSEELILQFKKWLVPIEPKKKLN